MIFSSKHLWKCYPTDDYPMCFSISPFQSLTGVRKHYYPLKIHQIQITDKITTKIVIKKEYARKLSNNKTTDVIKEHECNNITLIRSFLTKQSICGKLKFQKKQRLIYLLFPKYYE